MRSVNIKSIAAKALGVFSVFFISANQAFAESSAVLKPDDFVGISFWLISMALIASTVFFFLERDRVSAKWKTSLTVSGLVTLVAAVHYFYMREVWVSTGSTPTVFRYIDWLITVPLLMIEFYLILSAITKVPVGVFWRLMIGTLVMLIGGYLGEAVTCRYGPHSSLAWQAGLIFCMKFSWARPAGSMRKAHRQRFSLPSTRCASS